MPRLSLWRDNHSNDYKFQDNRIRELFTAGGTGVNIHKYLGPNSQDATGDITLPTYNNATEKSIQDLLFLENRDRKYDRDIYTLRGHYTIMDTDFNLSQFGLFVTNDTLFFTFHINDMIERMGRKIMPGDVMELPHLRDYNPLDPNDEIPIALKKYYVVQETTRAAEGFAPTWWPHLWRAKVQPMVDGQEYRDILNEDMEDALGNSNGTTIRDYLSTYTKNTTIDDAIIAQAAATVPLSGYDESPLYVMPTDENGYPAVNSTINADTITIHGDTIKYTADYTFITAKKGLPGYLTGDGMPPNGAAVQALTYFPDRALLGDFVLRMDFLPHRLFRFDGTKWVKVEDAVRANLLGSNINTQLGSFFNNSNLTVNRDGTTSPEKVALSQVIKAITDH